MYEENIENEELERAPADKPKAIIGAIIVLVILIIVYMFSPANKDKSYKETASGPQILPGSGGGYSSGSSGGSAPSRGGRRPIFGGGRGETTGGGQRNVFGKCPACNEHSNITVRGNADGSSVGTCSRCGTSFSF